MTEEVNQPVATDWDSLESNPSYKTLPGDTILSKEPYAQELYNVMIEHMDNFTLTKPEVGTVVNGHVTNKIDGFAEVDINWRESAFIDLSKENPEYAKYIQEGCEIEVYVKSLGQSSTRANTGIEVSYSELVKQKLVVDIKESIGKNIAYKAKVTSLIYGGYFLEINGVKVFMPGSQGGMNKLLDFESLLGQEIYVCPINYDKAKNFVVVSHRAYLKTQVPSYAEDLEQGQEKEGVVTGSSKFGVFVEFDKCLTGLIHKSDLATEESSKYDLGTIKPGDKISFKIKEVVDPFRIVLTQKEWVKRVDPWENIKSKYSVPSSIEGKIKKIVRFGMFVELEPGLSGLLHKSSYDDLNLDFEQGDTITVELYRIDTEEKKLYFKL